MLSHKVNRGLGGEAIQEVSDSLGEKVLERGSLGSLSVAEQLAIK